MSQSSAQPPATWSEQVRLFMDGRAWLRYLGLLALAHLVALLLGVLFMVIIFLLSIALTHLMGVWTPAYHFAGRIMGIKGMPNRLARPPLWFAVFQIVQAALLLAAAGFVIRLLFLAGFCTQNLICLLLTHVPPR